MKKDIPWFLGAVLAGVLLSLVDSPTWLTGLVSIAYGVSYAMLADREDAKEEDTPAPDDPTDTWVAQAEHKEKS